MKALTNPSPNPNSNPHPHPNQGPMALFNGWVPTYVRLGPHAILTFPLLEALRGAAGLAYI